MTAKTVTCIQIVCDICDTDYDLEAEGYTQHFHDLPEAVKYLTDDEWKIRPDGYAVCPADDEEHEQARGALAPKPPAVQVPGQQEIPAEPDPDADAPSCRDCGTWPCARHATDADRAEYQQATGSDEAETGGEPCRPCGGQGFRYTPGGEETVDCLLCGGTGVAGGAEQ